MELKGIKRWHQGKLGCFFSVDWAPSQRTTLFWGVSESESKHNSEAAQYKYTCIYFRFRMVGEHFQEKVERTMAAVVLVGLSNWAT